MEWELDQRASARYPLYSRAVVGDLCPDPVSPLTGSVGVGAELGPAWAEAYAEAGLRPLPEQSPLPERAATAEPDPVLRFGGRMYLNTSLLRLFGTCAGGADPMAFARQYLGERPDVPRQREERPSPDTSTELPRSWTERVLRGPGDSEEAQEHGRLARRLTELQTTRPELAGCTDAELVARINGVRGELRTALRRYVRAELATSVTADLLTRATEDAGYPGITGALVAGTAGAITEGPFGQLYQLVRLVNRSEKLTALFDQGLPAVLAQLESARNGDVGRLRSWLVALRTRYGHQGPAEWELSADTCGTNPLVALAALDVLRPVEHGPDPAERIRRQAERSGVTAGLVRRALDGSPRATARFDAALAATGGWLLARQRIRSACSALHHEQRLAARELGQRHVRAGLLDGVEQIFMLLGEELDEFVADPAQLAERLRMRAYDYYALGGYQPPYVTVGQPASVVHWPNGSTARPLTGRGGLQGTAVSPGTGTGPAKLPRTPTAPGALRPGDVLVLPTAGPNWVPLLPIAAAVVVDNGAALSDVAVACRDLGIPCVTATVEATSRISEGVSVEVDGSTGIVRLVGAGNGATPSRPMGAARPAHRSA